MAKKSPLLGAAGIFDLNPYARRDGDLEGPPDTPVGERVQSIALDLILPDPRQPRMVLPRDLHAALFGGRLKPARVLDELAQRADQGDGEAASVVARVIPLAESIAAVGLINPITVFRSQAGRQLALTDYTIESGERRWWAHWWLARQDRPEYRSIRCLVVEPRDVRVRQLTENLHREDLTAVETAVGLAALILEIEGEEIPVAGNEEFIAPRLREVAAGRLKSGTWPLVVQRLGHTANHWRRYVSLVHLCDDALAIAHAGRLRERALRTAAAREDPDEQVAAVRRLLVREQEQEQREEDEPIEANQEPPACDDGVARQTWWRKMHRIRRDLSWVDDRELAELRQAFSHEEGRQALRKLRDQIDRVLAAVEAPESALP